MCSSELRELLLYGMPSSVARLFDSGNLFVIARPYDSHQQGFVIAVRPVIIKWNDELSLGMALESRMTFPRKCFLAAN